MEQKFRNEQHVTIIESKKNTEADIPFIGKNGVVSAYDPPTTIYIIKFDDETTRPFYENELIASQESIRIIIEVKTLQGDIASTSTAYKTTWQIAEEWIEAQCKHYNAQGFNVHWHLNDEFDGVQGDSNIPSLFTKKVSASGRKRLEFVDAFQDTCELLQSREGHMLLFGRTELNKTHDIRMQLTQEQVRQLLPVLTHFAETGELF